LEPPLFLILRISPPESKIVGATKALGPLVKAIDYRGGADAYDGTKRLICSVLAFYDSKGDPGQVPRSRLLVHWGTGTPVSDNAVSQDLAQYVIASKLPARYSVNEAENASGRPSLGHLDRRSVALIRCWIFRARPARGGTLLETGRAT
jgi:hypothetical protein